MQPWISQARKGLVELCVLAALEHGEAYGYEILSRFASESDWSITESTLYPLLSRLTSDGILHVRTGASPSGPPRRYYRLTSLGKIRLHEMKHQWRGLCEWVDGILIKGDNHE